MKSEIKHFWNILATMTARDYSISYKNTALGFLWLIVNPLLQMITIGFVFTYFIKEPIEHYYHYLFISLLVWNFFSSSLNKSTTSIVNERTIIKKAAFPRSIIPMSIVASGFIRFMVAFLLFLLSVFFLKTLSVIGIIYIIVAIVLLFLFLMGICFLTSALNVRFRDVNYAVHALLLVWFYATPVVYNLSQIPESLHYLWKFNPLTSIFQLFHTGLLGYPLPALPILTTNVLIVCLTFITGLLVFRKESPMFDDWL